MLHGVDFDGYASELLLSACFLILFIFFALGEGICEDGLIGVSGGVRNFEDLFGTLSEFVDLALDTHFFDWVFDLFDVDHALVGERVEEVEGFDGFLPSLLVAKDQINPLMQVVRYVLRL